MSRSHMFGDLPHYFDEEWDENGIFADVLQKELCPVCKAHLSKKHGICLNACHLGEEGKKRFVKMMMDVQKSVDEDNL